MQTDKAYTVRPGTIESGKEYEFKMGALVALRCIARGVDDMWIVSNACDVGAFDDVVLHVQVANQTTVYQLQLKHKENPDQIEQKEFLSRNTKEAFSLLKYSNDIGELKRAIVDHRQGIIEDLGDFSNIFFGLFTNRTVNQFKFLDKDQDGREKWSIFNTKNDLDDVYKINFTKVPLGIKPADLDQFSKVYLLANQLGAKEIDDQVVVEMTKIFTSSRVDYRSIAKDFIKYVTDWAKGNLGKPPSKHYYLGKQEVVHKLSELFFRHYEPVWSERELVAYDDPKKSVWNSIVQNQPLSIIDSSEAVDGFLPQYIWSEVKRYCRKFSATKFIDCLNDKDRDSFFKAIDEGLERQMLKIVGGYGKITVSDIYKGMWMVGQLPLILEARKVNDYQDILTILQLSLGYFRIILINGCGKSLDKPDEIATFRTLQDLTPNHKDKILKKTVQVQGRKSIALANLVDDKICGLITAGDVIKIIQNTFSIGDPLPTLPKWFIRRNLGKILIKAAAALESDDQEVFLIKRKPDCSFLEDLDVVRLEDVDFARAVNVVEDLDQATRDQIEKLKKSTKKVVHYCCVYDQASLEWRWSTGSIDKLRRFVIKNDDQVFDHQIKQRFCNPINIISDSPGMGKSCLLDHVALQAPADKWILRVNLNASEYHKYYRSRDCKNVNTKAAKHLNIFCKPNTELDRLVFDKMLGRKDVVVLLDAFDEVSFSFKTEATNIAKSLCREGYQMWLTTRPHMKRHLEQEFGGFGVAIKPFTVDDRKKFLINYYTTINADLQLNPDELHQFIHGLLEAAQRNLHDGDAEFTGVPLQTRLLADFFNDDCRNNRNNFDCQFDLVNLYDKFVEEKIDILCAKFGTGAEDTRRKFIKKYQSLCALKLVFTPQNLAGSFVGKELADYFTNKSDELELLQRDGIIVVENLNISCVHQTFAEFLSAEWLADTLQGGDEDALVLAQVLIKLRFAWDYYHFVFSIFDRILAKSCGESLATSLHLAVINRDATEAKRIIETDSGVITELDGCSRSVLHVLALYTTKFPLIYDDDFVAQQRFNNDDLLGIIDLISDGTLAEIEDDVLGYRPLDYALANWSFTCAKVMCEKSSPTTINSHVPLFKRQGDYLSYCIELGYQALLNLLLPHFLSRNLLLNVVDRNTTLKAYVDSNFYGTRTQHLNQELQTKTVTELMRSELATSYLTNNHNADFFRAIILDSTESLDNLTQEVNQKDANGCALVHYACLHGKLTTLQKLLLVQDLEIDSPASGFYNNSPLHCVLSGFNEHIVGLTENQECRAAVYTTIVGELLNNGASTNKQNNLSKTPLHYVFDSRLPKFFRGLGQGCLSVIKSQQLAIVRLLISHGVDVDAEDMSGALHMVVQLDHEELIAELLDYGADVNRQDWSGNTSLHCARAQGRMADFLVSKGADADIKNDNGESPFDDSDIIMLSVEIKK